MIKKVLAGLGLLAVGLVPMPAAAAPALSNLNWSLAMVGAPTAWAMGATGRGVSVLVIDTGLDATMARTVLAGHVLPSYAAPLHGTVALPCLDPNPYGAGDCPTKTVLVPNPTPYLDSAGHGSFVACEIACQGTRYGIYGIAPGAKVAMAKVFGTQAGADARDIAAAIRWGAIRHFPIISMSLGSATEAPAIAAAVAFAQRQGSLVVAAAGNSGEQGEGINYPGALPGVIAVGSIDRWWDSSAFSSYGPELALSAPGDFVVGIAPAHKTSIACAGLCTWEGTSMATPLVAGGLADLMSLGLTTRQAERALLAGVYHWPGMDPIHYGAGVLSLPRALTYARRHGWITPQGGHWRAA